MFDDAPQKSAPAATPAASGGAKASPADVVVRVMPKDFYGKAVKTPDLPKPVAKPAEVPRAPAVAPVALPGPSVVSPKNLPPVVLKRRSRLPVLLFLTALLFIGAVAIGGYYYTLSLRPAVVETPTVTPPAVVTQPTTPAAPVVTKPVPGTDTDTDGLTNVEEILYGTDFRNPDSDSDTFLDGNEIFHRYDPKGVAPSTLFDTGAVYVLQNADIPFTVYYPVLWHPTIDAAAQRVAFRSNAMAEVTVSWVAKDPALTLEDWYLANVRGGNLNDGAMSITKEGYYSFEAKDARTVYLDAGSTIYTFVYDLKDAKTIEFLQTFKMMVNSFRLEP